MYFRKHSLNGDIFSFKGRVCTFYEQGWTNGQTDFRHVHEAAHQSIPPQGHTHHCVSSTAEICVWLLTPSHLMYLWHFPCNLFSYTNDHQAVCPRRVSSVSCLQDEASRVGVSFFFPAEHAQPVWRQQWSAFYRLRTHFTLHLTGGFYFYISCISSYFPLILISTYFLTYLFTRMWSIELCFCVGKKQTFLSLIYSVFKCYIPIYFVIGFLIKIFHV